MDGIPGELSQVIIILHASRSSMGVLVTSFACSVAAICFFQGEGFL